MTTRPTRLALDGNALIIDWSDGQQARYDVTELRRNCPCASCVGHHGPMTTIEAEPPNPVEGQVTIVEMPPVGNYAYKIHFSDGHDTGLYTFDYLRRLAAL